MKKKNVILEINIGELQDIVSWRALSDVGEIKAFIKREKRNRNKLEKQKLFRQKICSINNILSLEV